MSNINLLKKYAFTYLSKYDSTKKNLIQVLKNKVLKIKDLQKNERDSLNQSINIIVRDMESNNIINDKNYANIKIMHLFKQGKSENFIKNTLRKKGIEENLVKIVLRDFEMNIPDWKIKSAENYASKKKLGKFGNKKNKNKDLAKMARAGFNYQVSLKTLGYD